MSNCNPMPFPVDCLLEIENGDSAVANRAYLGTHTQTHTHMCVSRGYQDPTASASAVAAYLLLYWGPHTQEPAILCTPLLQRGLGLQPCLPCRTTVTHKRLWVLAVDTRRWLCRIRGTQMEAGDPQLSKKITFANNKSLV